MAKPRRKNPPKLEKVTYDEYEGEIVVGGTNSFGWDQLGEPLGSLEAVGQGSLTHLRDALLRAGHNTFAVSTDRAEHFDAEYAFSHDTSFSFESGKLLTKIEFWLGGYADENSDPALEDLISRYLAARRSTLEFFEAYTYSENTMVSLTYASPYYNRSVRDLAFVAFDAKALLSAAVTGSITPSTGLALLLGGHVKALVGLYESAWLEAKRAPYNLADEAHRLELALDVAALANSESGGLLVIGLATKKDRDGDRIAKVTPTRLDLINPSRYRQHLDRLIYPAISGLELHTIRHEADGLGLLAIEVPVQPEEIRPFLVSGALIHDKLRGGYFSIPTRRSDARLPASPAEVHGLLSAGRLATRLRQNS
ncbi:MAG: hypothetical protein WD689_02400 [Gaiellaceae bacterium]